MILISWYVCIMELLKPSLTILLAGKRLEKCSVEVMAKKVLNTMKNLKL